MTVTATKTSLENKHLGNGDDFPIIASSSHPLFQGWKLNNWTLVIHYSFGVSFNYSLLVLQVIPISSR